MAFKQNVKLLESFQCQDETLNGMFTMEKLINQLYYWFRSSLLLCLKEDWENRQKRKYGFYRESLTLPRPSPGTEAVFIMQRQSQKEGINYACHW